MCNGETRQQGSSTWREERTVTLIEKENRVLPGWEAEAGERVAQSLAMQGVTILLDRNISLDQIEATENGVCIHGLGERIVEADLVLMATGRKPNSVGIGLGALGRVCKSCLMDNAPRWR